VPIGYVNTRSNSAQPMLSKRELQEKLSMAPKENLPKFLDSAIAAPMDGFLRADSMASFKDKRKMIHDSKFNTAGLIA
jgi:hypothetical protein